MIHWLLAAMAVVSIVIGNLLALLQTNIKRMMGYPPSPTSVTCWR